MVVVVVVVGVSLSLVVYRKPQAHYLHLFIGLLECPDSCWLPQSEQSRSKEEATISYSLVLEVKHYLLPCSPC